MAKRAPEIQRVARLVDMLVVLSQRPLKRRELAERYQISERQITSDLQVLRRRLSLEIVSTGEGYRIASLPSLPSVQFDVAELFALLLATLAGSRSPGVPRDKLASAIERLQTVLPQNLRRAFELSRFQLPSTPAAQHREQTLKHLADALARGWTVEMEYRSPAARSPMYERLVDPYALVPYLRGWYLIGWCHARRDWRTFKVDRITRLCVTRIPFKRRQDFDLGTLLTRSWGIFEARTQPAEEVELLFSQPVAHWMTEEQWHHSQRVEWLPDGRLRFSLTLPVTPDFTRWVLSYGGAVEVVRPEKLREHVQEHARAVLERYQSVTVPVLQDSVGVSLELGSS
jgi:predicted DNA-binding transcriptional regulator YafY